MGEEILKNKQELLNRLTKRTEIDYVSMCYLWKGALNYVTHGHGIMKLWKHSPKFYTHRLSAYIFFNYDMNSELQINHKCSNANCWNPDHLYIGTQSQNLEDRYKDIIPIKVRSDFEKWARKNNLKMYQITEEHREAYRNSIKKDEE